MGGVGGRICEASRSNYKRSSIQRADVGEYGDYMGTLHHISALVVWEMWDLEF